MKPAPRIWLLIGQRRGDNNQVLALGEALGIPFETRSMRYTVSAARAWLREAIAQIDAHASATNPGAWCGRCEPPSDRTW